MHPFARSKKEQREGSTRTAGLAARLCLGLGAALAIASVSSISTANAATVGYLTDIPAAHQGLEARYWASHIDSDLYDDLHSAEGKTVKEKRDALLVNHVEKKRRNDKKLTRELLKRDPGLTIPLEGHASGQYMYSRDDGETPTEQDIINDLDAHVRRNPKLFMQVVDSETFNATKATTSSESKLNKRAGTIANLVLTDPQNILFEYFGSVNIGTPAQTIPMLFDTGSYQFWTASTLCTTCDSSLTLFDGSKSSTYTATSESAPQVSYQDGTTVNGVYAVDDVTISGIKATGLTFEEVTESNDDSGVNGIVGMGYSLSPSPDTWFEVVGGTLDTRTFSYYIGENDSGGGIVFGGVDVNRLDGDLVWLENRILMSNLQTHYVYYDVVIDGFTANNKDLSPSGSYLIIVDTGTSLTYLPVDDAAAIHSALGGFEQVTRSGSVYYGIECSKKSSLGNMTFKFGSSIVTFTPDEYLFTTDTTGQSCISAVIGTDSIASSSSLTDTDGNSIRAIMGNSLLRNLYTVFDNSGHRVGFGSVNRNSDIDPKFGTVNTTGTASSTSQKGSSAAMPSYRRLSIAATGMVAAAIAGLITML